jgi:TP901 family phage tail tape measure protein
MEENIMPDTNFGNPFMANMNENPVHKIVVEVRNKAVPTRADVMQSKEGTFIAVPVEYDPNKDHAYKFAGPNQKKLLKEFGENFISVTQFGSIIEGIDDTSAINKINKILKSVGIEKIITGELKAVTEDMMDSVEKEVKRLSPEYGKEIENVFRRIKNFRAADTYGNAFHRAIELLEKEGSNDPRNIEKVLKRMAREKKADKTYGNVLSDVSDGDRSRNALLKDIDAYFKKKTELGLGNIAGAEQQLGAVVKIGNEIVKIAGTFDQLFLKTNYILRDLKTSSSKQPSPAYGLQLNLLEKLLNSVGISVSEKGITRVKKGEAFDYKIGKISDQDITKLISMVLDIQKEKNPNNREALQVQARNILGGGAIQTRVGKRGRQTTYNDMTLGDIQKYSYLTEDQKIDLVKNLFSGMSARDKDLFVSSLFNTNKYGKEGAVEPSNDFYRKGPFYDRLRKEIPNPYFGTASSDFGYKEFETKEGEKVGGSVYGGLFASQNAQKYRILKAKYGEAIANKFLDQMLRDIDSAIGSKTDDKTSYETAKSAESFFRSLGLVEDKTPLNQDFVKRIDELASGYRNISEFLERERFGDLGGQLQGISKEEQALMARSSSDYRGIKETDQIFKTLASLREIGEGAGGLFDTIKKMEVDSKNIEDPKELLNKYSDILYSIFSGFSDFKDLISKSIKNLGRVSEIDEFGNYLEENKSEQILDYINDFYSNAENIIKNSQLTPEVQQNLISRLSYARSTERNGSISHQIGYRVARGVGVYDYINSILAGGLKKANTAAQEKGMVELSPEQYAAFVLSPEAFSQYSLSKKFKENYQNKKNLPQFLRDFVSDSSYDESAEFASLKKQVAEEFINPTTRMFEDTRVYINEAGNVVSGLNVVSDILGKQLSDKSGEFNLAGEFKTLENEPEWANRILRGMGVYRVEDVDKKMESFPQFYGAIFPKISDDRKNEIEKRKKELEEEKERLDNLVGEHGAEYNSEEFEKIADEYEKIANETEKLNDELKTLTSAESSRENLLSQIKTYLDEQNNIYNQTIQTIEDNYKEVGNVSGTESHPEDFDTPEEKRDYFLKTAKENLLKRTGGLTSQTSDDELLNRLTSDGEIVLNKELSNLLKKYSESQGKVGTVSGYSAEQVEMIRNMMEVAKVGYEYQQKQLEEIKKAQEDAERLQKENEEKVNKIKERAVNSKKAYEAVSVEITETEDFLKPDFVEDEEKIKRSASAKRGWETRRKKQGNLLAPAPANVTTSPVQTAQSGPIHVIIDGTVQGDFKNKKTVMETWDADGNLISFSTKDISKRSGSPRGTPQLDVIKQIKEDTGNIVQMMASGVTAQNIQSPRMMSPGPGRAYRVKKTDDTEKQRLKNEREYQALLNKRLSILDSLLSAQKKAGITQGREKQSQLDIVEEEKKRLDDIEQRIGVASGKDMDPERKKDIEYLNSLAESTRKVKVAAKDRGNRTIFDVIKSDIQRATMRITDFGLAARVLNTARKEIQQVYQNILKLDEAMTNLRIVTGSNTEQAKSMMNTYNDLAMQLGTTTQAVAQSAAEWLRQGYSVSEANELIKSSTYLSRLGFMDMGQSVTALTSVMKGFRIEATNSMDIVDKLTQLDAKYATTAGDIATALSRTSAVAREAGLNLDQTAAALTTMIDVSQQDASSVGNAFRTILARYGNVKATAFTSLVGDSEDIDDANSSINDTEKVLGAIGTKIRSSSSDMRDFDDVMDELADKWVTLTDVEKNAVATALAGELAPVCGLKIHTKNTFNCR